MNARPSRPSYPDDGAAETLARAVGVTLRESAALATTESHLALEAERLKRAMLQISGLGRSSRRSKVYVIGAAALSLAAAASVAFYLRGSLLQQPIAPLRVEVASGAKLEQVSEDYVATPEASPKQLRFSDGSNVTVAPYARLRLSEVTPKGASLLLEKGHAEVQVVHHDASTKWSVAAGPFAVVVTGTRFDVAWAPATEHFQVSLYEGQVEIAGPKFASSVTLKAGQRFEASATESGFRVTPLSTLDVAPEGSVRSEQPEARPSNNERDASRAPENLRTARHADSSKSHPVERAQVAVEARPATGRQWAKLVASGEFRQVTREADSMGLMVCLAQCSASDLRALADASRYIGRLDTAEAALRALHDNHPAQSTTVAYLLGVVDESRGRNASALRWYNEYLSRASGGSFASEAKAARLRMLVATGDKVAARRAATEYLERYPSGSAAGLSRRVLEGR